MNELESKEIEKEEVKKLNLESIKIKDIIPYKNNAKLHPEKQIEKIRDSIISFGYCDPIAVDENNIIIEGHGRLLALKQINSNPDKQIQVIKLKGLSENEKKAYRIAHNKIGMDTDFDLDILKEEFYSLEDTDNFEDTGFDTEEITQIWDKEIEEDDFEHPKEPKYKIELGEIWELGEHRLMCGDSTNKENVDKLMNGVKADMVFTDPPYNLGYDYNEYNDNLSDGEYVSFCDKWYKLLSKLSDKIIITPGKQNLGMWSNIEKWRDIAIWLKKNAMSGGRISNLTIWEPILFFGKFDRDSRPTDLYEINLWHQKDVADTHTCPKPITLVSDILEHYSCNNDIILDIFGGSGTTLIACEQLNRKCFMMEIDPYYVSVIIERWEKLTNKKAVKLESNKQISIETEDKSQYM